MADDFARQLLDALYNPEPQTPQQPAQPQPQQRRIGQIYDPERLRRLGGIGEAAMTFGSGLLGSVPAGLAGMAELIPTRGRAPDVNRAAQRIEDVQGAMTYMPRGETGQRVLQKAVAPLEMLGAPAEYIGEKTLQYTGSPAAATAANVLLDPVNFIGMPGSGKATVAGAKALGRAAAAAPRIAGEMAQDLMMGKGRIEGQRGAIKMKGGNWLAGEVEEATEPLRSKIDPGLNKDWFISQIKSARERGVEPSQEVLRHVDELSGLEAVDKWIDKKLNRYIKNEMATPEDPVRKLAEQGILHYQPPAESRVIQANAQLHRGSKPPLGQNLTARQWEDVADAAIFPQLAEYQKAFGNIEKNPWLNKVSPETEVYGLSSGARSLDQAGFDHLIDELKNSIRPDSDLPAHLRWKPEDLEKVTMEQAVRRVHDINQYRAQKKAEANEVLARNPATFTFKEYPTIPGTDLPNERGLAWKEIKPPEMSVELPQGWSEPVQKGNALQSKSVDGGIALGADLPDLIKNIYKRHPETPGNPRKALEEALKYEGDVMGHCVGGYCDDVLSGRTKIYSLRDNKGEPLVTIEVKPKTRSLTNRTDWFTSQPEDVQNKITTEALALEKSLSTGLEFGSRENWQKAFASVIDKNMGEELPAIEQIKGSGKKDSSQRLRIKETGYKDEPDAYLLPFIQDFVRSGNWSLVNDIQNTGLITPNKILSSETRKRLEAQGVQIPKYMTEQEAKELSKQAIRASDIPTLDQSAGGMKRGGSVHISDNPDTMQLELAAGGAVAAAKAAAKAAEKAAAKAKPVYPQAEALERARQNAVKMLNLPENNTPEMRAQAMGYIDYLHGTQRLDRLLEGKTLDPRRATSGPMPYGTTTPELASSYATSKADTSRRAADEGDVRRYFEVAPKDIGIQGLRSPLPVETAWHFMSPEQQAKIRELAPRVGYENLDEFTGNLTVHPEGVNATLSPDQWNWLMKNEAKGNPLSALRHMWYESGQLVDEPETLGQIYRLAGVNAPISQTKAPWTESQGVLLGKARITNPIDTSNTEQVSALIEPLKQAFARDRSRTKAAGPDQWAKDVRYTPRSWVSELEKDLAEGKESYVWTSIPDKVTAELRRLGFNGIIDRSGKGGGAKEPVVIPFDPAQVRSRFAAFDPAEMDVPDLLKATGGIIKAATKAVKPTAEQAATMAAQRAEMALRSRAMQELKDQFENLPQPPKGFLSSESILQRMDEIRRREATPSGEQIPLLKNGGGVEMQAGGALRAAAKAAERAAKAAKPEVLPAAEREANLKKMLKSSHVKRPVYHGTNKTDTLADESGQAIRQFDSYVNWFTQDPYHASGYATQDGRQIEGAATYPAYLSLQRPLHLRGDLNDKTTYAQFRKETGLDVRPGPYQDEVVDGVEQMIPRWWITNSPSFADAARAAGFDGVIANEGGTKTFGVFYHEPGKIKSAIGNRGTFDVTNPDITKKRGGSVKFTDNLDTMRLAVQKRK